MNYQCCQLGARLPGDTGETRWPPEANNFSITHQRPQDSTSVPACPQLFPRHLDVLDEEKRESRGNWGHIHFTVQRWASSWPDSKPWPLEEVTTQSQGEDIRRSIGRVQGSSCQSSNHTQKWGCREGELAWFLLYPSHCTLADLLEATPTERFLGTLPSSLQYFWLEQKSNHSVENLTRTDTYQFITVIPKLSKEGSCAHTQEVVCLCRERYIRLCKAMCVYEIVHSG